MKPDWKKSALAQRFQISSKIVILSLMSKRKRSKILQTMIVERDKAADIQVTSSRRWHLHVATGCASPSDRNTWRLL